MNHNNTNYTNNQNNNGNANGGEFKGGLNGTSTDNEDEDFPPQFTTLANEFEKSKWSHIDDLDEFFTRVYLYHQNHGMPSVIFMEFLNLFQTLFLACFSIFMLECIDYKTLFQNQKIVPDDKHTNGSVVKKNTLNDVIYPLGQCISKIDVKLWFVLTVVIVFWLFRLLKAIFNIARYAEIRSFYISALNIQTKDLPNITWNEVQEKLLQMQRKHHLCIHKQELTELDIYNRILRFKNYKVAMINQGLLPPRISLPFLPQLIFMPTGFLYNFEFLFFWGPFAPFRYCYQLRPEFKIFSKRSDLTAELSRSILILGLFNLFLAPAILVWQLLQFIYNYTELLKRDPGVLGSRKWSSYGRLYFRHFNELDHELDARLSRAYKPALLYLSSFQSKFLVLIAKFFAFTFGSIFAVLVILTLYDEDVLNVEHVLTIISITGAVAGIARSLIPDENTVYYTDQMMYQILAHVHYMPDAWKTHANSNLVRDEFVKLFQYKFVYLLEELLSPVITPFVLLFWLRPRAARVVDFLRNFTVEVAGVGDVCSFAQMDTKRHGNPRWLSRTNAKKSFQARNGKTELSLIHFVHTNPNWKMPMDSMAFIDQIKDHAIKESTIETSQHPLDAMTSNALNPNANNYYSSLNHNQQNDAPNSLNKSLFHLQSLVYNSNLQNNLMKSNSYSITNTHQLIEPNQNVLQSISKCPRGAVSRVEGPLFVSRNEKQALLSIAQASTLQLSTQGILPMPQASIITTAHENSLDMCFSALYMHELHRKYHRGEYMDLDNLKEENDEENENNIELSNPRRPLINKRINFFQDNDDEDDSESDNRNNEPDNDEPETETEYENQQQHPPRLNKKPDDLKLSHNSNNSRNTTINM